MPQDLHARFKAACALRRTRMVEEVTRFVEDWTRKNG
ncbi:plasmid partition protein ParG [Escherichia coli]